MRRKRRQLKGLTRFLMMVAFLAVAALGSYQVQSMKQAPPSKDGLTVRYIDVGQGDAVLVTSGEHAVLIDGGDTSTKDRLLKDLQDWGVTKIDVMVATHPHADHIGGLANVMNNIPVGEVYLPDAVATTQTFENFLDTVEARQVKVSKAFAGGKFTAGDMTFSIVAPVSDFYDDLNNYSICLWLHYGQTAFLFTGDAEKLSERAILESGAPVAADVLKVGHHGSSTSTSDTFLDAVNPTYAVISCGKDNSYGHPHKETLDALKRKGVTVLRTDEAGTVTMRSDGQTVTME